MKLVASMICHNELGRYLPLVIEHLLKFCDEVRVVDDYSTDGTFDYLEGIDRVEVIRNRGQTFDQHEGNARNELLRWTLLGRPTHILAIDADEFIGNGQILRRAIEQQRGIAYGITMEEVWKAGSALSIRQDGGWRPHAIPILYQAPPRMDRQWQIAPRQLACGREPLAVRRYASRAVQTGVSIFHFGWTQESGRQGRYDRYMSIDGGRFHNNTHLQSIMWPASRIALKEQPWPETLEPIRKRLLAVTRAK